MELEELRVYKQSMKLSDEVWHMVNKWDFFNKDTMGKPMISSADAVATHIAEGFGRYHHKEVRQFGYYARGALFETKTWLTRAHKRNIIDAAKFELILKEIKSIEARLNKYVNSVRRAQEITQASVNRVA
ncbi:MAG: four helix bundle protein [Flavobacteriales bacterium]|nr:four helix bundle protein [Flavobacteriales bacterium]MBL4734098.1 four helix bundle protein [Flavobacteriales bacterium]